MLTQATDSVKAQLKHDAHYYAGDLGLPVFQLQDGGKVPRKGSHAYKDATTDADQVEAMWTKHPNANIGVPTGKVSGIYVVDGKGGSGEIEGLGPPSVKTPLDYHWYFRWRPGLPTTLNIEGVDCVRSDGFYVAVPPSVRPEGNYEWLSPFSYSSLPEFPQELCSTAAKSHRNNGDGKVVAGSRHVSLVKFAAKLRRLGWPAHEIHSAVVAHNDEYMDPPKDDPDELRKIAYWTEGIDGNGNGDGDVDKSIVCRRLSDIKPQTVDWLWPNRVAKGKNNLFYGDGGVGKSFALMDMMARLTTGTPWPDCQDVPNEAGTVILLNAEDDPNDTIRVRFDAQAGDPSKVLILDAVKHGTEGGEHSISLAHDLDAIEQLATRERAKLLVVDPATAYAGGKDICRDDQVRDITTPLKAMAERLGMAVVLVMHTNKSATTNAKYKAANASAWINSCRMAWMFAEHPDDPRRRTMTNAKNNLAFSASGLCFSFDEERGCLLWDAEPYDYQANDVLEAKAEASKAARGGAAGKAEAFLGDELASGPVGSKELLANAIEQGISRTAFYRASESLGIVREADKFGGGSLWNLPL